MVAPLPKPTTTSKIEFKKLQFWTDNPRIGGWIFKKNEETANTITHQDVMNYLLDEGADKYEIKDLAKSILDLGLEGRIMVNKLEDHTYLVFEGNRRLAALQHIWNLSNYDLNKVPEYAQMVDCDVYSNLTDEEMHTLCEFQHGDHVKKKWTPYDSALSYKLRMRKENKQIDELSTNKRSLAKIKRHVQTIDKMHQHGCYEENKFSYFEVYINMSKPDDEHNIRSCFSEDDSFKKFESHLVATFYSEEKMTGAQYIRDVLNEARQNPKGRKKIRDFAKDGNFQSLVNWFHSSGRSDETLGILKQISDDFFNQNISIKNFLLDPKNPNNTKNAIRQILKNINRQVDRLMKVKDGK